ncbi:hypothetical protein BGZ94_004823, partial [Podila epigama]
MSKKSRTVPQFQLVLPPSLRQQRIPYKNEETFCPLEQKLGTGQDCTRLSEGSD